MRCSRLRIVALAVGVLSLALPAMGQDARECECILRVDDFHVYKEVELAMALTNPSNFVSASGEVFGHASAFHMGAHANSGPCENDGANECFQVVSNENDIASADLIADSSIELTVTAINDPSCTNGGPEAYANAQADPGLAKLITHSGVATHSRFSEGDSSCSCPWVNWADGIHISTARARANSSFEIQPAHVGIATMQLTLRVLKNTTAESLDCDGYTWGETHFEYLESFTLVQWGSLSWEWSMADGTTRRNLVQFVLGDVVDESGLRPVCLGGGELVGWGELVDDLREAPDGGWLRDLNVPVPPGWDGGVVVTTLGDSFGNFDGDIDDDGDVCTDDSDLMNEKATANPQVALGDLAYTPRADFDLNGVIDMADLAAFDNIYTQLPDCNNNGIPDLCDIAEETSQDANANEVPDECECVVAGDCDDGNVCTDDACVGEICQHTNNTAPCNDGLFCTATDTCSGGACTGSGDACPGQICDEVGNVCIEPTVRMYVDDNAPPQGDGLSWEKAFTNLQLALAAANGPLEIRVAQGTYYADALAAGDRDATFHLLRKVSILGGFQGAFAEPPGDPDVRSAALFPSVLDGDIGSIGKREDNTQHVVTGSGVDATAVLDGFVIRNGHTAGEGAGILIEEGSPTISNCLIHNNDAFLGGGMFCANAAPAVVNCEFRKNASSYLGGGMMNIAANPTVMNCLFYGNSGCAMHNMLSEPNVTNCTFYENSAYELEGAGMLNDKSAPVVSNCIFWANRSYFSIPIDVRDSQIYNWNAPGAAVDYSCIEDEEQGDLDVYPGGGNIDRDPRFEKGADFRLTKDSPCIDSGRNNAVPTDYADLDGDDNLSEATPLDLVLSARFVDTPDTPDTGKGKAPLVDMGAYEHAAP